MTSPLARTLANAHDRLAMALFFKTENPAGLLAAYKKAIDDNKVDTWKYDKDGDFTHTPEQWNLEAWLRPKIELNQLAFYILKRTDRNLSVTIYAVYHGRFCESLLKHCDK